MIDSNYKKLIINCIYAIIKNNKTITDDEINLKLKEFGFNIDSFSKGAIDGIRAGFEYIDRVKRI